MSLLSKLFNKSTAKDTDPETYKGFTITPHPMKDGSQWRMSAVVAKDGRSYHLIRADTLATEAAAHEAAVAKAKQLIDQMGDGLFGLGG